MFQVEICSQQLEICKSGNITLIVTDADTNDQSNKAGARYVFPIYTHYKERNLIFPHYGTRRINVAYSIMLTTIRNLQIRVHVYRPQHCCGD
jgi:hypothetical protein